MRAIEHKTVIAAPPAEVWAVLADTDRYPEWNPFITSLDGSLELKGKLRVRISPPGGRPMTFRPTVVDYEPGTRVAWLGRLGVPGLFDGRHTLTLEPLDDGRTRFIQHESFTGLLVPFTGKTLARTEAGFRAMNDALADRVQGRTAAGPAES